MGDVKSFHFSLINKSVDYMSVCSGWFNSTNPLPPTSFHNLITFDNLSSLRFKRTPLK